MAHDNVARSLKRAERAVFTQPVLESVFARREAGRERPDDAALREELGRELCRHREPDGSWNGSVTRTAEALLLLAELLDPAQRAARVLAGDSLDWLRRRQGPAVLAFGGCEPWRHELGICKHGSSAFFAVAPVGVDLTRLTLSHGVGFLGDTDARVGGSSLALAAVLTWGVRSDDVLRHLDALVRITGLEQRDRTSMLSTNTFACVCRALFAAPVELDARAALPHAIGGLAKLQRADGSWPDGELFFVLDVLGRVSADPECAAVVAPALSRAANLLALLQKPDGNWGRDALPWHLLVGWRVLRAAAPHASA